MAKWREEVLYVLEHKYGIRDYAEVLPEIEASHQPEIEASLRAQGKLNAPEAARAADEAPQLATTKQRSEEDDNETTSDIEQK